MLGRNEFARTLTIVKIDGFVSILFFFKVHTFNFIFVPIHYRVLFASMAQFLSNTFLSFVQFGDFKQFKKKVFLRMENKKIYSTS